MKKIDRNIISFKKLIFYRANIKSYMNIVECKKKKKIESRYTYKIICAREEDIIIFILFFYIIIQS